MGNRKRAPAYNLKTHSAFKLLTMAAGYKVLCRRCGEVEEEEKEEAGEKRKETRALVRGDAGRDRRDSKV